LGILWSPPFEGGREGDLKGDFDLLYFMESAKRCIMSGQIPLIKTPETLVIKALQVWTTVRTRYDCFRWRTKIIPKDAL